MNQPVVELKRNLYGHPLAGLLWDKASERWITKQGFKKVQGWECLYYHLQEQLFLGVYVDDFHMAGNQKNMSNIWERLRTDMQLDPPVPFDGNKYLGCTQQNVRNDEKQIQEKSTLFKSFVDNTFEDPSAPSTPKKKTPKVPECSTPEKLALPKAKAKAKAKQIQSDSDKENVDPKLTKNQKKS